MRKFVTVDSDFKVEFTKWESAEWDNANADLNGCCVFRDSFEQRFAIFVMGTQSHKIHYTVISAPIDSAQEVIQGMLSGSNADSPSKLENVLNTALAQLTFGWLPEYLPPIE